MKANKKVYKRIQGWTKWIAVSIDYIRNDHEIRYVILEKETASNPHNKMGDYDQNGTTQQWKHGIGAEMAAYYAAGLFYN